MKNVFKKSLLFCLAPVLLFAACRKEHPSHQGEDHHDHFAPGKPLYTSLEEFKQGLAGVIKLIESNHINAYLDTLRDGNPDPRGRRVPLSQLGNAILQKLSNNQVEAAVHDVFHFDGSTFSLISYLKKAEMLNEISPQALSSITAAIPLAPIPVQGFDPPLVPAHVNEPVQNPNVCTCTCDPKVKIKVTYAYRPACGNYEKTISGYAAGNTLTGMKRGVLYRFDAEVEGCGCGGTWTQTVSAPAGASYGSSGSGSSVNFIAESAGTYTITFTYTCGCCCGKKDSKTFTLTIE